MVNDPINNPNIVRSAMMRAISGLMYAEQLAFSRMNKDDQKAYFFKFVEWRTARQEERGEEELQRRQANGSAVREG